ncbi:HAUS augmin-like complex subunit 5 isoform X2 [Dunckerocampus dactyliophorus]|uniref:HAUS augmin-like complex subunit 5 isoform X2 n=1 Tax=Dunckerocampus dactyliophorus TaxID=161453 RepID=UPI0024056519|nr:HAUS augmin-like complex subunit 5 isoform X2 [Dunckerocampus dactyliophorus]XP_054646225.1 HAUS augmin-like complex subunit 5 isoform X2 [Dunckerocampus dactyliophorus]XP_054646226.1 HAUS augmin-like complex subunit 5 isoform X2 [Dunckerocampus dactyliophorus]
METHHSSRLPRKKREDHTRKSPVVQSGSRQRVFCVCAQMKQTESQSVAAQKSKLQGKIEQVRSEISHLDSEIRATEEQMASQEQSITSTWAQVEDSQRRKLLLQAFRQSCVSGRMLLSSDIQALSGYCQTLEQMARKAEVEVLFENHVCDGDTLNSKAAVEAQVLRKVRELCNDRVHFYQSLQESVLKTGDSGATRTTSEQRTAVFEYWLSAVENLLGAHPPNHILSALQHLASREQKEFEEKATADVTQDMTALGFRHESDHLLDISGEEENDLPCINTLLQAAWQKVEESLIELSQTRSRVQQLQHQLLARRKEAEQELSGLGDDLHSDSLVLSSLDLELQCVMKAAARDHIRDGCMQLDQHARSHQEALRNLHSQWQSVVDFRQLVLLRQDHIRSLIKGNSSAKTDLIRRHKELQDFLDGKMVPQFNDITNTAANLRNSISKEVKQMGTVSLHALDRRAVDGMQRIPASWLSIHRLQSPTFSSLCRHTAFPLYRAPEELWSKARDDQLELRFLRQLLQHHSATLRKSKEGAVLLLASDHKVLLSRVKEEDEKLLQSLVPRVRGLTRRCAQGISYGEQVKTAISHWWDQPAQHVLPEVCHGGLTFQQWLQRWKLAAKA